MEAERYTAAQFRELVKTLPKGKRKHKYGAKAVLIDGHVFPSLAEGNRYKQLRMLERAGKIRKLELQPRFDLKDVNGKVIGLYIGDFAYSEYELNFSAGAAHQGWRDVVEDVKGMVLQLYRLKRDLFRAQYPHIDFREIKKPRRAGRKRRK